MKRIVIIVSKVVLAISAIVLLSLALTNPSLNDFKEFCPDKSSLIAGKVEGYCYKIDVEMGYRRIENNTLFSYYKFSYTYIPIEFDDPTDCSNENHDKYYLGILSNFYEIPIWKANNKGLGVK
jgi:hypothetical protein